MIEDALDISRLENNKFEINKDLFDLRGTCNELANIMKFQIEQKGIEMKLKISRSVPSVIFSDQKRLKQILFNLIGNALKFTYKGGITLNLKYDSRTTQLTVSVRDTGIGIKPEDLVKLFHFFGQVSSSKSINKSGMGLGLTISKMII